MAGLIDFFMPPRTDIPGYSTAWAQLGGLLGPDGHAMPSASLMPASAWEALRPTFNAWEAANSSLGQSINWRGMQESEPFWRAHASVPNGNAPDTPSPGRSPDAFKIGPREEAFPAYDRLKTVTDAGRAAERASANVPMSQTQPDWNIPPPEQSDLKPRATAEAQMMEGRETGPSDSEGKAELPWPAARSAPLRPDRIALTGPSFRDWLLPVPSMAPFGLPPKKDRITG